MIKLKYFMCFILAVLGLSLGVAAEGEKTYVVKVKPSEKLFSASLFGADTVDVNAPDTAGETAELLLETVEGIDDCYYKNGYISVDDEEILQQLVALGVVEYAEENGYAELYGYDQSVNPFYKYQWGYPAINADYAMASGIFGKGVRVAVIDSGVYAHDDLKHCLVEGYSYVGSGTADTVDTFGHGTQVSGVIAAQCNEIGVVGIAPNVEIIPLRVTVKATGINVKDIASAVQLAVDEYDADVINMSLGTSTDFKYLKEAVDYAVSKGAIVVAASGNNAQNPNTINYPAGYQNVVSVGNVEQNSGEYRIYNSSVVNSFVNIAAPGTLVVTTHIANKYVQATGTSFSCPMVAAAAALAKQINPNITASEFSYYLAQSANSSYITAQQDSTYWGKGLLDIEALIKLMLKNKKVYIPEPDENLKTAFIHNPASTPIKGFVNVTADGYSPLRIPIFLNGYATKEVPLTAYQTLSEVNVDTDLYNLGDVNGDNSVNVSDCSFIADYIANTAEKHIDMNTADANNDGVINVFDAVIVAKLANLSK